MKTRQGPLAVMDVSERGDAMVLTPPGPDLYVKNKPGSRSGNGYSWDKAFNDMEYAFEWIDKQATGTDAKSNGTIHWVGDVRKHLTAPLNAYGWRLQAEVRGRPRHATEGGVLVPWNGALWREAASSADAPLLILRQQGWEVVGGLFVPRTGYPAIKPIRAESATYPDSSHFRVLNAEFLSSGSQVGYAFEDVGGQFHIEVGGCRFRGLEWAWLQTSVGIASPQQHWWHDNDFLGNKNDIALNALACRFERNKFRTPYNVTTHPITLNLQKTADVGAAATPNNVIDNDFADTTGNVVIAKGYKAATGDNWRNRVAGTAADIVAVPV